MKYKYILAFKDGHDPAAAIMHGGKILAAVEEERFTRLKHSPSVFPRESIKYCLEVAGILEDQVDFVVYSRKKILPSAIEIFKYYFTNIPKSSSQIRYALNHMKINFDAGHLHGDLQRRRHPK